MPRDDLSSQRSETVSRGVGQPSPTKGCAKFIGRVGALAVVLGLGAAIANSSGIAWADTTESDSSSGSASSSASEGAPGPKASRAADSPASRTSSTADQTTSETAATPSVDSTTEPSPAGTTAPDRKPTKPRHRSGAAEVTSAGRNGKPVDVERSVEVAKADEMGGSQPDQVDPQPLAAVTITDEDTAPATAADSRAAVATPARPATPPPDPALWALLGWVRRELGQSAAPAAAASATPTAVTTTSLVEPMLSAPHANPLATRDQLAAEKLAAQVVKTWPVQLMKLVLKAGFLSAAEEQFAEVGGPDQENLDQLDEAVNEYAMASAFQQQLLNSNEPTVVMQVAPPHTWYWQNVSGSRILYDNPDTIYRFMGVNAASTYVINGRFAGPVPADTTFSLLTGLSGNTAAVLNGRDLDINPDGTFTITVSRSPAADGEANHIRLTNDSTLIATRNTLSDWNKQVPMSLSVERIEGPPDSLFSQLGGFAIPVIGPAVAGSPLLTTLVSLIPPMAEPPPLLRGIFTAVIMALGIQRESTYMAVATRDPETGQLKPPNEFKDPTRNAEFLATQLQSAGYFQLTDDQALVLTIDPGNAGYFVVPVTNDWTITDDYWRQQTSLNNAQAKPNPDGTYTIVISPTDPRMANWVSTGGLNQGTVSIRFQDLDASSSTLPTVSSQVVSLEQLRSVLPESTRYVTRWQREHQIVVRRAGFNKRFAPFHQH